MTKDLKCMQLINGCLDGCFVSLAHLYLIIFPNNIISQLM